MNSERKKPKSLGPPKPFSEEWFILKIMEQWTPRDVERAISNDISLVQPIANLLTNNGPLSALAKTILKKYWDQRSMLTPENVLFWLENRRKDLYRKIVSNPEGVEWVKKNVNGLRDMLEKL